MLHTLWIELWFYSLAVSEQQILLIRDTADCNLWSLWKWWCVCLLPFVFCGSCQQLMALAVCFRSDVTGVGVSWAPSRRLASPSWRKPRPESWPRKWVNILFTYGSRAKKRRNKKKANCVWLLVIWWCVGICCSFLGWRGRFEHSLSSVDGWSSYFVRHPLWMSFLPPFLTVLAVCVSLVLSWSSTQLSSLTGSKHIKDWTECWFKMKTHHMQIFQVRPFSSNKTLQPLLHFE